MFTWRETSDASRLCPCPGQSDTVIPDCNEDITGRLITFTDDMQPGGRGRTGPDRSKTQNHFGRTAKWSKSNNLKLSQGPVQGPATGSKS